METLSIDCFMIESYYEKTILYFNFDKYHNVL